MEDWKSARTLTADLGRLKTRSPEDFTRVKALIEMLLEQNKRSEQDFKPLAAKPPARKRG